jgi:Holliday junction resolvase RusA-like endonuclease
MPVDERKGTEGIAGTTYVLPWPPSHNEVYRFVTKNGRTWMYMTAKGKDYKALIEILCRQVRRDHDYDGPLELTIEVYPPDGHARDCHNQEKILFDSLEGVAYANDRQIWFHSLRRCGVVKGGKVVVVVRDYKGEQCPE